MTDTNATPPTETTPTPPTPETPPTPTATTTPDTQPQGTPDGKPQGRGGKKPFRDRPKQDRPQMDFTSLTTNVNLRALDADIEAELANAMTGFEDVITKDSEAFKQESIAAANTPKEPGGRKKGIVLSIHGPDVFIDVPGGRSQGVMSITQFDTKPSVGDEVEFAVEGYDGANGVLKLTKTGVAQRVDWSSVQIGQTVEARVLSTNKGGLSVEVNGIRGFLPIGQIDLYRVENAEQYVNQRLICMVAEVDREENNLVVSRKALLERERELVREKFWAEIQEGDVRKGTIRSIQPFGAFVDLGGADGLLPVSELAWGRVGKPEEVVSLGQSVEVKVKKVDRAGRKMSLSLKDLMVSPWDTISQRFPAGTQVTVKVTRMADFGAFAELEPGVEGLIHISEANIPRGRRMRDRVQEGSVVEVQILTIDKENRRIGLSIKAIEEGKRKAEVEAAKAEMAAREAAEETTTAKTEAEDELQPKKRFPFTLRGGR